MLVLLWAPEGPRDHNFKGIPAADLLQMQQDVITCSTESCFLPGAGLTPAWKRRLCGQIAPWSQE
jgi:hypothetical protein